MERKEALIDGRGHLLGRLASVVAKTLLNGDNVSVVRAEEINISGPFFRNKIRYMSFLKKRCLVNPKRGPIHFRAPSKIFWRTVRGMLPHKTKRGAAALARLKVCEGIPPTYQKKKRMVVPTALRVLRLAPGRKYTVLKDLSHEYGWKYKDVVERLEAKRKARGDLYHKAMVKRTALFKEAKKQLSAGTMNE